MISDLASGARRSFEHVVAVDGHGHHVVVQAVDEVEAAAEQNQAVTQFRMRDAVDNAL